MRRLTSDEHALLMNALMAAAHVYRNDALLVKARGDVSLQAQFTRQALMADRLADEIMGADGVCIEITED